MACMLKLPDHYNTEIVDIDPRNTKRGFDPSAAFCSLLDELKTELEEEPENGGFYHNRSSLVQAYGENRMFGLCAYWSEDMLENKSFDDPIFVTNKHFMVHRMLPCFIVLETDEDDDELSVCSFVWTAKRARNKGIAKYLLDAFNVRSVKRPLPEAEAFWSKHFTRMQIIDDCSQSTTPRS